MQNISHAGTGLAHNPKINALTARHTDKILFLQPAPRQRIQDDVKTTAVDRKTAVGQLFQNLSVFAMEVRAPVDDGFALSLTNGMFPGTRKGTESDLRIIMPPG